MRVHSGERNRAFIDWLRNDVARKPGPLELMDDITQYLAIDKFYTSIYPPDILAGAEKDLDTFLKRAILAVRNDTVAEFNEYLLGKLPTPEKTFFSADTADLDDSEDQPPIELLQSFNPPSLPPSRLRLKVGAPVMVLRNLYPSQGLCNGTRMVVTRMASRCIEARILGGPFHGAIRLIPRIKLTSTPGQLPYIVSRTQFPTRLCFAMTINKSQGQSFNPVGVDLRVAPLAHGQLYVVLSRVTDVNNLFMLLREENQTIMNIVYPEVLLD